jgi:putative transcriptional regulator
MEITRLVNHFLIAMPAMADPNFSRTLTYICEHNAEGAMGIVVNRPLEMNVGELFERVGISLVAGEPEQRFAQQPILAGGPVHADRGFVLHRKAQPWQSTLKITDDIALTSSRDILQAMGSSGEPREALISLGYAGWGAGQLEWELAQNAWLTVEADGHILFDLPAEERFAAAMKRLGVDFANLSEVAGHA